MAVAALGLIAIPVRADAPGQAQVETALTCQCGCGLTVHSCNHLQCGSAIPLKQEISQQIGTGKSLPQILAYFQTKYGEKILSSPTTEGFNIAAWTVPFIAIGLGGVLVGFVLWRWRRTTDAADAAAVAGAAHTPPSGTDQPDAALRARLERELAELERRS